MDTVVQIYSAAITDRGLSEKRPHNEDSYLDLPQRGVFAVADGVGGAQAGEVASQMAMEILGEAFANAGHGDAETVMRAAIERANTAIHDMANELPQLSSMATTIVALHLNGNIATIGHVGDSRLYRLDRDGELHRDTDDHSMVAEEVRAGRMTEEQAETHPSRNIISRALGAESTVEPDLKTIMVDSGTAFLLCSDGITRHVTDQEIKGVLTFGGSPDDVCDYLKKLCFERGAEDNLTAVVVRLGAHGTEHDTVSPIEEAAFDEPTVATVRAFAQDDDDLLDLDTRPLAPPANEPDPELEHDTISLTQEESEAATAAATSMKVEIPPTVPAFVGESTAAGADAETPSSSAGRALLGLAMLVVGTVVGIGAAYFLLIPPPAAAPPMPTEMRTDNIPLTAFEENRRAVDENPTIYIGRFGSEPRDCEDHYLLGRAYLLIGEYNVAKALLLEARKRLPEADDRNRKVLADDIAIMLAAISDTTVQTGLKKALETQPTSEANTASPNP